MGAERIAEFLSCQRREGFWNNDEYVVCAARGHLLDMWLHGLTFAKIEQLPATEIYYRVLKRDKAKINLMEQLWKDADNFIVATDFDREGETIGFNIISHLRQEEPKPNDIPRAYFSALTESELQRAFDHLTIMNEALLSQGLARNIADTIIGLNLTKALTILFKNRFPKLTQAISLGRVQSPLLSYIKKNVGVTYRKTCEANTERFDVTLVWLVTDDGDIDLPISEPEKPTVTIMGFEEEEEEIEQAELFPDTSTVQRELPFKPDASMKICESLYLKAWSTYPRTRSHFVPEEEVKKLAERMLDLDFMPQSYGAVYAQSVEEERKLPHWAIVLTLEGLQALANGKIKGREKIVAEYLLTKMAKAMAPPLEVTTKYADIVVDGEKNRIKWGQTCENIEDAITYEEFKSRPSIDVGTYDVKILKPRRRDVSSLWKAYEPEFKVFTEKDLVSWMEKRGLGTEATRHTFPVTLQRRNYTDEANLPNQLGVEVAGIVDVLGLSPELTAEIEGRIEALEKLDQIDDFKGWIVTTTEDLLNQLKTGAHDIEFKCPKDHMAMLINTRIGLYLHCDQCNKFYPL